MAGGKHFGTPELRRLLRDFYRRRWRSFRGHDSTAPAPAFPQECRGMLCGAKTRSGAPCRNDGTLYPNGRCKFHGGLSTGPKSIEGKARSAKNSRHKKRTP